MININCIGKDNLTELEIIYYQFMTIINNFVKFFILFFIHRQLEKYLIKK